jgi:UDP-2,3-diacylglucosamine pyrophosphatase LpxH
MEALAASIEFKDTFKLIPLFDMHLGAAACDENKLDRTIKQILDTPDCYTIAGGDMVDAILRQDMRRYMHGCANQEITDALDDALNISVRQAVKKLKPLADKGKLLGCMAGNHEVAVQKHHSFNISREICDRLDVPFLGYSCFYRLTLKKKKHGAKFGWVIYLHHGFGGGRKKGSSINNLIDLAIKFQADCYIMGHDHKKITTKEEQFKITHSGAPKIVTREKVFVRAGTFLKSYLDGGRTTYSEQAGYPPTSTGAVNNLGGLIAKFSPN